MNQKSYKINEKEDSIFISQTNRACSTIEEYTAERHIYDFTYNIDLDENDAIHRKVLDSKLIREMYDTEK